MTNLYQESINAYLAQVYMTRPDPLQFITISSHQQTIPSTGTFTFPNPLQLDSIGKTQYFISGISFADVDDNLALQQTELQIQIICGGQTWVAGQLGLLDTRALKNLIIPIPARDVEQEIELIIQDSLAEKTQKFAPLNYDVAVATSNSGEEMDCYRQIIYSVPETGIIHDGRNRLLGCLPNSIARIEVYVPDDLDVELPLDYQPKIYCDNLAIESSPRTEPIGATTHNQLSEPAQPLKSGYKTYSFDGSGFAANSLIMLGKQLTGHKGILFSIIEKQIVRVKNGYIGLAF